MDKRTPVTLKAVERKAAQEREGTTGAPSVTTEQVRAMFSNATGNPLLTPNPFPSAAVNGDEEYDGAPMVLDPRRVKAFDRNPRRTRNPEYDRIRASIEVKGLLNPVTVTRRPGESQYMIYGGGNTRLTILQELIERAPQNPLYQLRCNYRAWKGEADILAAHYIENDVRGDLTWWDKACTYSDLKAEVEKDESRGELSANEFRSRAAALGITVGRRQAQLLQFTATHLAPVGPWLAYSSADEIRNYWSPVELLLTRLKPAGPAVPVLRDLVSEPLQRMAADLQVAADAGDDVAVTADAKAIQALLLDAGAKYLNKSRNVVASLVAKAQANPQITAAQLEAAQRFATPSTQETPREGAGIAVTPDDGSADSAAAPTQAILPTPMLAPVAGWQRALPPELDPVAIASAVGMRPLPPDGPQHDASPADVNVQLRGRIVQLAEAFAASCHIQPCFHKANEMPLGYYMDLPTDRLRALGSWTVQEHVQVLLRHTAWSLLATISGQFDAEVAGQVPTDSSWSRAMADESLRQRLVDDEILWVKGLPFLDANGVFLVLTEPKVLAPTFLDLVRAVHAYSKQSRVFARLLLNPLASLKS